MGSILTIESFPCRWGGLSHQLNPEEKVNKKENVRATLRGLKKEYQHSLGLTVELDKVLLIIGSLICRPWRRKGRGTYI